MCSWSRINFLVLELVDYYSRVQTLWYTGSSDGQTKVVREGDNGVAYAWNLREQKWDKVIIFYILHCLYQAFCYALVFMWLWNHPFLYFASFHLLVATVSIFSCTCIHKNYMLLYLGLTGNILENEHITFLLQVLQTSFIYLLCVISVSLILC